VTITEPNPQKSDNHNRPGITATYEPKKLATTLSATLTQNPEGKLIPLDRLFQEGHIDRGVSDR
jgi:hypothetical protein